MKVLVVFTYIAAVTFFLAAIFESGNTVNTTIGAFSFEGFKLAIAWAVSWFQAGGNMIPNQGWRQAMEAWSTTAIER